MKCIEFSSGFKQLRRLRQWSHFDADSQVIAVKSVKARKPAAKKPARKASRRSSAETAMLQKAVIKGLQGRKVCSGPLGGTRNIKALRLHAQQQGLNPEPTG
jgi:hypothetical protein